MQLADAVPRDLADTDMVSPAKVAEWLDVTVQTIHNWGKKGTFPKGRKVGPRMMRLSVGEIRTALRKMDRAAVAHEKE